MNRTVAVARLHLRKTFVCHDYFQNGFDFQRLITSFPCVICVRLRPTQDQPDRSVSTKNLVCKGLKRKDILLVPINNLNVFAGLFLHFLSLKCSYRGRSSPCWAPASPSSCCTAASCVWSAERRWLRSASASDPTYRCKDRIRTVRKKPNTFRSKRRKWSARYLGRWSS